MTGYNELLVDICIRNIIIHYYNYVTGVEESSINQNSNKGRHENRASPLTIELLRPTLY